MSTISTKLFNARVRRLLTLLLALTTITTGFMPVEPAAAVDDLIPPSVPTNLRWSDNYGLVSETVSNNTTITANWNESTDNEGGSGVAQYRLQVSQDPGFATVQIDRYTGSTTSFYSFGAADGIQTGHSYYVRAAAVDVNGNQSGMSGPSNRVDITDQSTGPEIVHQPVVSAYYGRPIPIKMYATCESAGPCAARLFYRTTGSASIPEGAWQRVDLPRGSSLTRVNNTDAYEYNGTIPGWAVTTTGVDYYLEAEDSLTLGYYPGYSAADSGAVPGVQGGHVWAHVQTVTPPLLTHQPTLFAQADNDIPLSLDAVCSTNNCTARLYYRTTTGPAINEPLLAIPNWPSVAMSAQSSVDLGDPGKRVTYTAKIPKSYVDTRGVDYFFHVTDGYTQAFWPGTTHEGYYVPEDGQRIVWHHVHVLEPPRIVHAPVLASPYRQSIAITAESNCPVTRNCTATLYYRTTTSGILDAAAPFNTAPMTVTVLSTAEDNRVIKVDGTIPGSYADTRGVDYFFSITDGTTTSWYPGTSQVDGYQPVDGTRVGYQHTRVLEPPHIFPAYVPATPALQDLTVEAAVTCATEHCDVTLHSTSKLDDELLVATDAIFKTRTMTDTGVVTTTPAGRANIYRATIPAAEVTTRGVAYFIQARDGYTKAFSPGTFYAGAYVITDGTRFGCAAVNAGPAPTGTGDGQLTIDLAGKVSGCATQLGAHVVRVLEPPHTVHVPVVAADAGQALPINAASNCSTPVCTATLHWRVGSGDWKTAVMSTTRTGVGVLGVNTVDQHTYTIPALDVTPEGLQYWISVADGYVTDSTVTYAPIVRGAGDTANYPPGIPDYPQPEDRAVRTTPPTELSARYVDPESMPGFIDFELVDATNNLLFSGTAEAASNGRGSVQIPVLSNGAYRWRARARDGLGASSVWSSYWTLAVFNDDECGRFVGLWEPRVSDAEFVEALRAVDGYPADILAEGFHAFDESARRMLIDCLYNQLNLADPLPPTATAAEIQWFKDMLYKLIFDKASLVDALGQDVNQATDQAAETLTGATADALNAVNNISLPAAPAGLTDPLPAPIPKPQDLIPEDLMREGEMPVNLVLPEAQSIVDQADNATSVLPQVQSTAEQVINDERLPIPIIAPFKELVRTVIQLTTYRACYESPTKQPTCTDVIPLGTPVPADVTGDGTLDVLMQLTPFADPAYPLGVTVKLSAKRLLTSEKASGSLKAHVWFIYDVATADKRLRLGFDGMYRGDSLADNTDLTYTIKEPLALTDGNLVSHYTLAHQAAPANWALEVGWSSLVPPDQEVDPLFASAQFSPPPASLNGDFEVRRGVIPAGESRDLKVTANSSVPTKVDAIVVNEGSSKTPVRLDARRIVIDKLPTTSAVTVHQEEDVNHQATTITTDNSAVIGAVQVTTVSWADKAKTGDYAILVGELRDVPAHVLAVMDQRASTMDFTYNASSVMTQVTAADLKVANNVLSRVGLVQADAIPATMHLNAGGDANTGVQASYAASSNMSKLLALYYDARNSGTIFLGRATSIPTSVTASATIADRKLTLDCNQPIGVVEVLLSRGGAPVLVLGGDHATLVSQGNTIGASARITGVEDASFTLNQTLEAHTKLVPGGQPFQALVYLNNRELGYLNVSNVPATMDVSAAFNSTAPTASYRASSRISHILAYYTDLADGPTLAADFLNVPSSIDLTATMADPARLDYVANSSLDQLLVVATPLSALKVNSATMPYVLGLVQGVPSEIHASMDLDNGDYTWNASAGIPVVIAAARGISPVPANAAVVVGALNVPSAFEGHVNAAARSFSWTGITGSIGKVFAQATNYGRVTTFAGPHVHAFFDQRNGQWDASAAMTGISAASVAVGADLKSVKASLSANTAGQPLVVDGTLIRNPGLRVDVRGYVANFPSWVEVTANESGATYKANTNVTAAFRAAVGWINALNTTPEPPWVYGLSAQDGSCGAQQGCGGTNSEFCISNGTKCLAYRAAIFATGLPTTATVNWANKSASITNYRPASPNVFAVWANIRHTLPVPFFAYIEQQGIPQGVNMSISDIQFVKRTDNRPMQVGFNMTASQPLGRLWAVGAAYGVFNGADIAASFDLADTGNQIGINASLGGVAEAHIRTSTASPTNITITGATTVSGVTVYAQAALREMPTNIDLVAGRVANSDGVKLPTIGYTATSNNPTYGPSTMDGYLFVDGRMTTDVGPFETELRARLFGAFTNLGASTSSTFDLPNKTIRVSSTPATTQLYLSGSFIADTDRYVRSDSRSFSLPGSIKIGMSLETAVDIGPTGIEQFGIQMLNVNTLQVRWKIPFSFSISGNYSQIIPFVRDVKFTLDELSAKIKLSVSRKGAEWVSWSDGVSISKKFSLSIEAHVMRNIELPQITWDLGVACAAVKSRPSAFYKSRIGVDPNRVEGVPIWGMYGEQEVWFEPYNLVPGNMLELIVGMGIAKFVSTWQGDVRITGC